MRIQLYRTHYPVTALGPGVRYAIWMQGCTIGCSGCISRDTWDPTGGTQVRVDALVDDVASVPRLDGVTISGGEPFEQPEALGALLTGLADLRDATATDFDVLCFSGYPMHVLEAEHRDHLRLIDALVPEPYNRKVGRGGGIAGSANQPTILLTDRARRSFQDSPTPRVPIQIVRDNGRVTIIGTPAPGDLDRLAEKLETLGIDIGVTSWMK